MTVLAELFDSWGQWWAHWRSLWSVTLLLSSVLWSGLTVVAYVLAQRVYRLAGHRALALPVLTGGAMMIALLMASHTTYEVYAQNVALLKWMLAPALVLLAVPLRQQLQRMRSVWLPLSVAVVAGSLTAVFSTWVIGRLLDVDEATLISMLPKSATMPIAIQGAEALGGISGIVALNVVITGVLGAMLVPSIVRWVGGGDEVLRGTTSGLVAHAIGTAQEMQKSPTAGAFAALAMSLTGVCTALWLPAIVWLLMR